MLTFIQISAEESILQMIPYPSLMELSAFNAEPTKFNSTHLRCIPALYEVLRFEEFGIDRPSSTVYDGPAEAYNPNLLGLLRWLEQQARATWEDLAAHPDSSSVFLVPNSMGDWKQVSPNS